LQHDILTCFGTLHSDGSTLRLVTLHGSGGMGKTRVAMACAVQAAGAFKDGVFFVHLEDTQPTKEAVAEAIGAALGMTGEATLPESLLATLRHKEMLLVLDNYESVDRDAVAQYLADLVTNTQALRLLVTGREAVKVSDVEQLLTLDEGMTEEEAAQLFIA